ncbi:hypothetical protein [Paenibacillus silviterrae]|uniref:hypothetical protein n=1 Tax=Paenibacillus silviterrae TaxID=3242194 RepID=UPI002543C269|nr:hypothetical protein [Paenibacillus chinjuensis]
MPETRSLRAAQSRRRKEGAAVSRHDLEVDEVAVNMHDIAVMRLAVHRLDADRAVHVLAANGMEALPALFHSTCRFGVQLVNRL